VDQQLQATRESQRDWSKTADSLKASYDLARQACLILSIAAALLAALASQLPDSSTDAAAGGPRFWLSITSGVLLALVTLFTLRFVTGKNAAWVRVRATSEALKRIAWTYAAGAAPYEDPATRGERLGEQRAAIETQVNDLLELKVTAAGGPDQQPKPPDVLQRSDYVKARAEQQKNWYEGRADDHKKTVGRLRFVEFVLAVIATALTVVVGTVDKTKIGDLTVDFIALTGVVTTVSGAILAYIEASRLDFLVTSYRAAARQLRDLVAKDRSATATSDEWSAYVQQIESVLATENGAWMAKVAPSGATTQPQTGS
jgi:hypothetical protein